MKGTIILAVAGLIGAAWAVSAGQSHQMATAPQSQPLTTISSSPSESNMTEVQRSQKAAELIRQLSSDSPRNRDEATEKLIQLGPRIHRLVNAKLLELDLDEETRTRLTIVMARSVLIFSDWPFDANEAARRQEFTAKSLGVPGELVLDLGNKVTMKLVLVPAGRSVMGTPQKPESFWELEPQHEVTITKPFYMGIYEVTQEQWQAVVGTEPWKGKHYAKAGATDAASYISWDQATEFCKKLAKTAGKAVSLPTDAQWEHACRAGTSTSFSFGDDPNELGSYAWYDENAWKAGEKYPHAVGQKKPNRWGLYDMHGNVSEWCLDWHSYRESHDTETDPVGPPQGQYRIVRGGSFYGSS
jgi:formylglycine-generating enzyme required for sulfatase activity